MKSKIIFLILGLFLGIFSLISVRFFIYHEKHTHFHANFAVFIEGKRVDFTADKYMEEINSCVETENIQPKQRAHLHENNHDILHVHDEGVTWAHFLINLNYNVGSNFLSDDKGNIYKSDAKNKLTFILNGKKIDNIANELIKSQDRLLINFGEKSSEELISGEYTQIASNAGEYNAKNDPASCSGHGDLTFSERLKKSVFMH